jgi:hypothetical protein
LHNQRIIFKMKAPQAAFLVELFYLLSAVRAEDPSQIAWRAYGEVVKAALIGGASVRQGIDYIYVTPPTVSTLQAGSPVPDAFTNGELYSLADTLQTPDDPIFATIGNSYSSSLLS